MNQPGVGSTRREFVKQSGRVAAATALVGSMVPHVHAAEDNTIRVALIGCGGRGTGAAANALSTKSGPIKLVAMADVFQNKLDASYKNLSTKFKDQVDVPQDRQFVSFDGYKQAMDCLRPGDVAIFATPPAFRWVDFTYAIDKNLNVFMEKPTTVDGPSTRKMIELAEKASQKNLKVGVGLMCRHCKARGELFDRIQQGEIGDIFMLRAYRQQGPIGTCFVAPPTGEMSELLYQIKNFHGFLWASGGAYSDFLIHNIDESCWMKNAWPVKAQGAGGRHYRGNDIDQNFDSYSVEYTFADGAKLLLSGRNEAGCENQFASYADGTKGMAVISTSSHTPAKCRIYKGQNTDSELLWKFPQPEPNPYQLEWDELVQAIRSDKPYNEAKRGAEASLVTSMGRMACHTGQAITYEQILNSDHEFAPTVDKLSFEAAAPLQRNSAGKYPVPMPGLVTKREYEV
jgi:predicted dehydrogenase